jgi:hypothetical protein
LLINPAIGPRTIRQRARLDPTSAPEVLHELPFAVIESDHFLTFSPISTRQRMISVFHLSVTSSSYMVAPMNNDRFMQIGVVAAGVLTVVLTAAALLMK